MPNYRIQDLSAASAVTTNMVLETETGGTTSEKITTSQLATFWLASNPYRVTHFSGAIIALNNCSNSLTFLNSDAAVSRDYADLATYYTQARITVYIRTTGSAGTKLILKYYTADSITVGDYLDIGTSEVSTSLVGSSAVTTSGWVNLAAGAKISPCYLAFCTSGGDGATDPAIQFLFAEFR
jgi:hypothetical protein